MSPLSSPSPTDSLFYSAPPSPPNGPFPTANDKHDAAGLGGPRGIKAYLRFANTVFVKGSLVTAAGLTLPVQLNSTALGVESAGLATWVVDGEVSVAAVPCDKCRALEYHRPEGNRPLPCLVRSASNRSDGENCVLCKVKRQSCCAELRTSNAQEGEELPVMRRSARTEAARATQRLEEERQVAAVHKDAQRVAQAMEAWVAKVAALPPARQSVLVDEMAAIVHPILQRLVPRRQQISMQRPGNPLPDRPFLSSSEDQLQSSSVDSLPSRSKGKGRATIKSEGML